MYLPQIEKNKSNYYSFLTTPVTALTKGTWWGTGFHCHLPTLFSYPKIIMHEILTM